MTFQLYSCSQSNCIDDDTMDFDKATVMEPGHILYDKPINGWRIYGGIAKTDRTTFQCGKYPVLVAPDTSFNHVNLYYSLNTAIIELGEIEFSGMYKYEEVGNDSLTISIVQLSLDNKWEADSIKILLTPQDTLWNSFRLSSIPHPDSRNIFFSISPSGSHAFRINNCKVTIGAQALSQIVNVEYDAEKDNEFDDGSGINLGELSPQKKENLEVLGKVWGFLKYYHPEITQGKYNWDYELFRILPQVANAKNKEERNKVLNRWIDKYGKIKEFKDYTITDSTLYSRIIDLDWINNREIFDRTLIDKLNKIRTAKRNSKFNYYQLLTAKKRTGDIFVPEKAYKNITWEDQGFRILLLFKLWNVIEYCFPYTDMTDVPWLTLLEHFIPDFFQPENKANYELAILKLAAQIKDSHGYINIPDNDLSTTIMAPLYTYSHRLPVELTKSAEGYLVVKLTECIEIKRGDIIYSVEGKPVTEIVEEMKPYIIASNEDGLIRNLLYGILSSDKPEINITVIRDGKKKHLHILDFSKSKQKETIKSWEDYNLSGKNIIHVDNIKSAEQNRDIIQNNMNSRGLILDMRIYPWNRNVRYMRDFLFPTITYPLWLSDNKSDLPGNFYFWNYNEKDNNPDYYRGIVAILVDENTQSAGETNAMSFSYIPQSSIIGSQTAGANGTVSQTFYLPHGIQFEFSGQGAFYPEGEILQRKGIKIDIPVRPTVQDIKEGRDVWIEKAIEYIENN